MARTRAQLLNASRQFCNDVAQKQPPDVLLSHFSTTHQCTAFEHGHPSLVPFFGKSFTGIGGISDYLNLISELLSYDSMKFSEYTVDVESNKVAIKGQAIFTAKSTKQSWDETFLYMLDFDMDGKVTDWKIWADTGAAYLALKGELKQL